MAFRVCIFLSTCCCDVDSFTLLNCDIYFHQSMFILIITITFVYKVGDIFLKAVSGTSPSSSYFKSTLKDYSLEVCREGILLKSFNLYGLSFCIDFLHIAGLLKPIAFTQTSIPKSIEQSFGYCIIIFWGIFWCFTF